MKKYSLLAFTLMIVFSLGAQNEQEKITDAHVSNYRDWAISLGFGNTFMNGDMKSLSYDEAAGELGDFYFGPTGYFNVTKYVSSVWGFSFGLDAGTMGGSFDQNLPEFRTFFINFYPQVTVNLSALALKGKVNDRKWSHIVKAGVGGTFNLPELTFIDVNDQEQTVTLDGNGDESWNNAALVALDYNLKYRLTKAFDLDLHISSRHFFGDNIDAFGDGYPANSVSASNRGNDVSFFTGVGVTYNFGNKNGEETNDKIAVIYTNPLDDMFGDIQSIREDYDKLTKDDDKDGVSNLFDKDNATPDGATVNGDGVASDVDNDGIPDYLDEDPFTIKGAKVNAQGRAVDSDGDGVADVMDEEPNTPEGALVNFNGVTIPTGGGSGSGAAMPSIFFNFNSATVSAANHYRLVTIAQMMKANSDVNLTLVGSADKRGPEEYNKKLGLRRAEEVKKQLTQVYGVSADRISTVSQGETELLANGRNDVNRRVDVQVK